MQVNEVPFRLTTPPCSFTAGVSLEYRTDPTTGLDWDTFEFDLCSHNDADMEGVFGDPEGFADDPDGFKDELLGG